MMDFSATRRTASRENIVPMINVVFLLLIFFLMTAQIGPPDPFKVETPETSQGKVALADDTLYISTEGTLAFEDARGDSVFAALAGRTNPDAPLHIRADANLPGATLARLLPRLARANVTATILLTGSK